MLGQFRIEESLLVSCFRQVDGNADGRQVVFHRKLHQRQSRATYIDFGYCFNAREWSLPDAPLRGVYAINDVYEGIQWVGRLCPWFGRMSDSPRQDLQCIADEMPCEWYGERSELQRLLSCLLERVGRLVG